MDHEVDPDSNSLNGLFDSWIHSLQTLKKMDVRQVDGKIVLLSAPTMQGNDGPFVFNEMRQMPSPEAEAKIRELRNFVDTFGPTFDGVRSMASKLDDIDQAWRELKTDVNRIVSAQGLASMPDEVLSNIFILAQRSQVKNKPKLSIAISQVCRRFREVAIGTPSLWNLIAFKMPEEMALTFLQRSGVLGLHVVISEYWKRSQRAGGRDEADRFFEIIHPYMGRIARLDINIDNESPASRLFAFMVKHRSKKGFPRLEDLRIKYHEDRNTPCPADVLLGGSARIPSIQNIQNITIGSNCHIPPVRFRDNITDITVELLDGFKEPSLRRLLTLLETSKSLKDVTLIASLSSFGGSTFQTPTGNGDGAPSITSFTLITKSLSIFNDETFRSFIRACRLPNVANLFIKASISDPDCCWPYSSRRRLEDPNEPRERGRCDCTPFIEAVFAGCESYPGLRVLEVEFVSSREETDLDGYFAIPFAQYTPHLEHFGVAASTLCKLWDPNLPALRTLRVEGCKSSDVVWLQNYVEQMTASGAIEDFETLRVSCDERVLRELRDVIRLPEDKIFAEIRYRYGIPKLDFHQNVASVEDIDEFTPYEIAAYEVTKLRRLNA